MISRQTFKQSAATYAPLAATIALASGEKSGLFHFKSIVLFFLTLMSASAVACGDTNTQQPILVHGPICVWHSNPQSECSLVWIEQTRNPQQAWFEAEAGFGYSDGDDATFLEMRGSHRAICIRHAFNLTNSKNIDSLDLQVRYDDGFVAFLNGHEVVRASVEGDIGQTDIKDLDVESHEAKKFENFSIKDPQRWLQDGENVLAIIGVNREIDSSDFSLHPSLNCKKSGQEESLIKRGEKWQVWVGDPPEGNWTTTYPDLLNNNPIKEENKDWDLEMRYRSKGSGDWKSAKIQRHPLADSGSTVGTASLKELQPGTEYQIELIGSLMKKTILKRELSMKTAPLTRPDKISFVNGGDMFHERKLLDAMNRQAGKLDPMFALLGGDLAYANARDVGRWYEWFDSWYENAVTDDGRQIPMIAVIGNHETKGLSPDHAKYYYSLFPLPEGRSNFVVDFGDYMSIVNLDSQHSQPVENQTQWLGQNTEATKR